LDDRRCDFCFGAWLAFCRAEGAGWLRSAIKTSVMALLGLLGLAQAALLVGVGVGLFIVSDLLLALLLIVMPLPGSLGFEL
jgi:hypothetical protein